MDTEEGGRQPSQKEFDYSFGYKENMNHQVNLLFDVLGGIHMKENFDLEKRDFFP